MKKNQFRPSSSSPSPWGFLSCHWDLQEGQVEEATSSLLAILQDILAGTVGATRATDLDATPPGEPQPDMADVTPKRPCSESAEVEVKRPRMADECLGKRKKVHRFFGGEPWVFYAYFYQSTMRHQQIPLYSIHIDVG